MAKAPPADIRRAILKLLPKDGTTVGNQSLRERIADHLGAKIDEDTYFEVRDGLIEDGKIATGKGRGGSVHRIIEAAPHFLLEAREVPADADAPKPKQVAMTLAEARRKKEKVTRRKVGEADEKVSAYQHRDKRTNNPEVGLVTPDDDSDERETRYAYDPHIDPTLQFDVGRAQIENIIDNAIASGNDEIMRVALEQLRRQAQPYLNWTGKAERTSFEVDTVSLHVHERIDPLTILSALKKRVKGKVAEQQQDDWLKAWFDRPLPLREAIEFYKHDRGWANRLIAGDSLLVMNSLLQKESLAGQVQMIYIDPPYGIGYGSNFQPFVNKREVKDRKDQDLTQEPEMIKAFRDTWELGIHSYLTYLRDRLLLSKELLNQSGSLLVQISDENIHLVKNLLDEIFGASNFVSLISFKKTLPLGSSGLPSITDFLVWYAKDKEKMKFNPLYEDKPLGAGTGYTWVQEENGYRRKMTKAERDGEFPENECRPFFADNLLSSGYTESCFYDIDYRGTLFERQKYSWKTNKIGVDRLIKADRLIAPASLPNYVRFFDDFSVQIIHNLWDDTHGANQPVYVVQTSEKVVQRALLMATDPGDLVFDPTCGSGTTAFVAEKWGRRWITCDTSRVAVTLAKQRLVTASFEYYDLKYPHEGLKSGFIYKTVPHVTLKSIANNPEIDELYAKLHPAIEQALVVLNRAVKGKLREWDVPFDFPDDWATSARECFDTFHNARQAIQRAMDASIAAHADQETLFDQPQINRDKLRITGPFTVEAVPFPSVLALIESEQIKEADASIARSGESARQHGWRDELLKTGIRGKGGQILKFVSLETLPADQNTRYIHCTGNVADTGERVVVSFGPEHAALEQRQVEMAMREASELFPRPKMIVFCAFAFDPEAAKDIDNTKGIVALKAQMNTDLLTEDLKKARASNQSFWLMGQPDVEVKKLKDGRYQVEVNGFDYFDTTKGELVSGGKGKIAAWAIDTDYDERSLFPRQVFFPMAGAKDGWNKLKRDIKAELDENLMTKFHGTVSLAFEAGENRKIAVKIVDDRGIESLKVIALD